MTLVSPPGFYTTTTGNNHGYEFNIFTHQFTPGDDSRRRQLTAAGKNKFGAVTGFYVDGNGNTDGMAGHPAFDPDGVTDGAVPAGAAPCGFLAGGRCH